MIFEQKVMKKSRFEKPYANEDQISRLKKTIFEDFSTEKHYGVVFSEFTKLFSKNENS